MDTKKIEAWANKLLDVGKRNNLINFKDSKTSSLEVVYPNVELVFAKTESSYEFEVFNPKLQETEDEEVVIEEGMEQKEVLEDTDFDLDEAKRNKYITDYAPKLKKQSQILLYNKDSSAASVIKRIDKKAQTSIDENGVNILFMAFGFIHWRENENSKYAYNAPILLSPISFRNDSAISPYYIQMSPDEVFVNPTFKYKLEAEYGVTFPEYSDGTLDEYLQAVTEITLKLKWTVTSECKIGLFSFMKLNMYEDLIKNKEKILANSNVRRLLGEPVPGDYPTGEDNGTRVDNVLIDLHNVVDADSSQLEAIQAAKSGKSFVLQGPPGTGKSQTITNIIAECLWNDKKVLFVSEKLAALNVVYEKLKQAGLSEFCLELHSNKANKKDFIEELNKTLRTPHSNVSAKADNEIRQKLAAQEELDNYERELHKKRDVINKSLYELYDAFSECRSVKKDVEFLIPDIQKKGEDYLEPIIKLLEQYPEYARTIGEDYRKNAWYGYADTDGTYENVLKVKECIQIYADAIGAVVSDTEKVSAAYNIQLSTLDDILVWKDIFKVLADSIILTSNMLKKGYLKYALEEFEKLAELSGEIKKSKTELDTSYKPGIYKLDGIRAYNDMKNHYNVPMLRSLNPKYKKLISDINDNINRTEKVTHKEAVEAYRLLSVYQESEKKYYGIEEEYSGDFGSGYNGINTDWEKALKQIKEVLEFESKNYQFGRLAVITAKQFEEQKKVFKRLSVEYEKAFSGTGDYYDLLTGLFDQEILDVHKNEIRAVYDKLDRCSKSFDMMENWIRFVSLLKQLKQYGLDRVIDRFIDNGIPSQDTVYVYKKNFYRQWIDYVIHQSGDTLLNFSRIKQDKSVEVFQDKDSIQFDISKVQIRSRLSRNRPSLDMVSQGSEVAILLREAEKKRKQKSILQILTEAGNLIQELKPCFLMSPLSVSTYLNSTDVDFDVVVFDEASQVFPWDAIGAIYRSKQLICVGDTKQMPPTNFFTASVESESQDEDEGDVNDFESILDVCSTVYPQFRLKWHYRSRYEQLISFSNRNFYQNELVTFPSAKFDHKWIGVDYFYVGGCFENRVNPREAEFIVDLVYENFKHFPDRSLGVVAFSISQQDLIERLLMRRRQTDLSLEEFFRKDVKEPFFVKNLETVQGDERDTIIFSIAYAKDSQGRMGMRLGPLGNMGGERRLNVAITRAKHNIQVVASIHCTDIDLSRTGSRGVSLLRDYLDYAEHGEEALERSLSVNQFEEFDSEFEEEVYDFLKENGFEADTQVGCSNFRIDIGLKRPNSSEYVLAIECDGATYHSSRNARDRDRLRQEILERMGWKFYRVWSTDWFRNTAIEKQALLNACRNALDGKPQIPEPQEITIPVKNESFEEEVKPVHFEFPKYVMSNDNLLMGTETNTFDVIRKIVEKEAPISEEWLLKRIVGMFGRQKVTAPVVKAYEEIMEGCTEKGITRRNGFLYLNSMMKYVFRVPDGAIRREIKQIAPEELAVGMLTFVKQNLRVERQGLYQSVAKNLGFSRIGDNIYSHLDNALNLISGLVDIEGDNISLRDSVVQTVKER